MKKEELFIESHRELMDAFRWIHSPMFYTQAGAIKPDALERKGNGQIIIGQSPVGEGIEPIHVFPKESVDLIIKTFCESHGKLKP